MHTGDVLEVADLRDRTRRLVVVEEFGDSRLAHAETSAYVGPGAAIRIVGKPKRKTSTGEVGELPNERILFDDGKIGGRVLSGSTSELLIQITQAQPQGSRLRADKGINFPDSDLHVAAPTDKDLEDLDFVAKHADLVGLSFVADPESILHMQAELARRTDRPVGLVLKIETQRAFQRVPRLLLAAMRAYPAGLMIARGDLAVECGFERLAEVQEELLWLCEAAHMPAIWATQVLE